ncbi:hypothetical protein KDL44_09270 [bacterium]|nr:hypothetical protein [bacterium]
MRIRIILLLLPALMLAGCTRGPALPEEPGLLQDGLGIGLRLLMTPGEAESLTTGENAWIRVLTTDQKHEIGGFDPENGRDEIDALYYLADPGDGDDPLAGRIYDIRCFLNSGQGSPLELQGRQLATQGADDIEAVLGEALERNEAGDGQIHLTYLFDAGIKGEQLQLRLVTSHHLDHSCYAMRLVLEPR